MLKNFLLIIRRNLARNKAYTFINIAGLALGMAAFILISAYVRYEESYDRMHRDAEHIYRVESRFYKGEQLTDDWPTSTNGYAKALKDNFPAVTSFTRINWSNSERVVRYGNIKFREEHVCYADTNFFSFFSYPLLKGDPATILKDANTMVISASAAKKYFGDQDPVGKILEVSTISKTLQCVVTGIFRDIPPNSTMQFNFLISWASSPPGQRDFWYQHESYTFVRLQPGTDIPALEAQFPALAERYKSGPALKELKWAIHLAPLTDIHLTPARQYEIEAKGNGRAVRFLHLMSFVILLIACVNYINLSTAKAIERAKEVGVRKVSGALPVQLVAQFLLESFLINVMALLCAVPLIWAANAWLPSFLGSTISYGMLSDPALYGYCALVFILSIAVSGLYPALVLARLKPVTILKGRYSFSRGGIFLRKSLVTFQFAVSLILIAGTLAVYRQLMYMNSQELGVNINQVLVIRAPVNTTDYLSKTAQLKTSLQAIPGVKAVTGSGAIPGKAVGEFLANRRFTAPATEERTYEMLKADHDFIAAYNLEILAGRGFDRSRPSDSTGVVLNESAVRQFGFASPEEAIGQKVWLEANPGRPDEVIGVIKDYHQQSLQQNYTPLILFMDPAYRWIPTEYFSIKLQTGDMTGTVAKVRQVWDQLFQESSFDYFFLDDYYDRQYKQERQFSRIFSVFSSLAVFIACLGLFGLTAYNTARRTKEIGVRKVLGATVGHIISLLTWESVRLILISCVAALPVAFLLITQWQQGYAFRAGLAWWQFAVPVLALIGIAVVTTGWLVFRAAVTNPSVTLKEE